MKLDAINVTMNPIENIIKKPDVQPAGEPGKVEKGQSFGEHFKDALREVDGLQKDADKQIERLMAGGDDKVSPHTAMIALEKADMAFQMMNSIRAKIVRAYEEVIRTQV